MDGGDGAGGGAVTAFVGLAGAAAVVMGMASGVLYAFSAFVMSGLREVSPTAGAAAMRSINRHAQRWPLGLLLLATLAVPVAAGVVGVAGGEPGAGWAAAGAAVTLLGVLGVTAVGNVPLNERLERAQDPVAMWARFVRPWLVWNHVRTAAGASASALLVVAVFEAAG
jgi:uncharacterized membrane protein